MKKILLALTLVLTVVGHGWAVTRYWDTDGTSIGNDIGTGAGLGSSTTPANWDTTSLFWWDGVAASALQTWADGNDAYFAGMFGTVMIPTNTTRSATGLTFKTDGYIIDGGTTVTLGTLTLTGPANLVIDPGMTAEIKARMTGTAGYNISGGGRIKFATPTNVNSTTGPVSITGGSTLEMTLAGHIGGTGVGSGNITLDNGTFKVTDTGTTFLTTNRSIILGPGGGTLDPQTTGLYSGIISGTGNTLTKTGTGELRLSGGPAQINTQAKTIINGGTVSLGQDVTLGNDRNLGAIPGSFMADNLEINTAIFRFLGAGGQFGDTITLDPNRGLTVTGTATLNNLSADGNIPGRITGSGGITKAGTGILTLSSPTGNDYAGVTQVDAGVLRVNNTSGSGTSAGAVIMNGGTLAGTGSIDGSITLAGTARIAAGVGQANEDLVTKNVTVNTGQFIDSLVSGTGNDVLRVTDLNGLTLNGGMLTVNGLGNAGSPAGQPFTLVDYDGDISAAFPNLILNNATGFDGTTIFNDGAVGVTAIKVTVGATAQDKVWTLNASGDWSIAGTTNWTSNGQPNGPGAQAKFTDPSITGALTVSVQDSNKVVGTLLLDKDLGGGVDNPVYTFAVGTTTGTRIVFNTYSGNASLNVVNGSHLFSVPLTFTAATTVNVSGANRLTVASGTNTGGMTKTGTGTLLITGGWAGAGAVNVNEGTLMYNTNAAGLSDNATITIAAGATMDMGGPAGNVAISDVIGDLAGDGNIINLTGAATGNIGLLIKGTQNTTYNGVITGTGANSRLTLNKQAGSLTLTQGQNYAGITTINNGTLFANNASGSATGPAAVTINNSTQHGPGNSPPGTLAGNGSVSGAVTVNSGGVISPGAMANTISTLTAGGNVTLNTGAVLNFDLNTVTGNDISDKLVVGANLNYGTTAGTRTINLTNLGGMTSGLYTLIDYATLTAGSLFTNLVLGTQPVGFTYALFTNTANTSVDVSVIDLPGDYDDNGIVDSSDYVKWRDAESQGLTSLLPNDPNIGTVVDGDQYNTWRANFGNTAPAAGAVAGSTVPEPGTAALVLVVMMAFGTQVRRRRS